MSVTRYYGMAALGLVLLGGLGCDSGGPTDTAPAPKVDMTPISSEEAAAQQAKTASKRP